jgi:hypothetical protein
MAPLLLFGHIKLSAPSNFTPLRSSIFTDTPEANTTGVLHMSTRQVQALAMVHPLSETMAARLNHRLSTKTHRRAPTLQPAKLRQQIAKGTLGFWYRFYQGPKGRVQYGLQYSYFVKNTWSGAGSKADTAGEFTPSANTSMVFASFRYYLP